MRTSLLLLSFSFLLLTRFINAQTTETFNHTGAIQTWVVPAGVISITIEAWGAQGGDGIFSGNIGTGGEGGYATGVLSVTSGETLNIYVGGEGQQITGTSNWGGGGFNGGGDAYGDNNGTRGGGGGASDIRQGGTGLANRVIVAGGGGGACCFGLGGCGGGLVGQDGQWGAGIDGDGGTQSSGGAGGCCCGGVGVNGTLGEGGFVPVTCSNTIAGGGGGYYGGGAGNNGGGGSGYIGGVTAGSTTQCGRTGHGLIEITYTIIACMLDVTCPLNNDLGSFYCNTLGNIPAHPTNQAQAAAAPYNITFGLDPCGTILVDSSDDMLIDQCGTVGQTITRTVFIWDDLPGGTPGVYDPGTEMSASCIYTYDWTPDTTPPVLSATPANTTVECDAVPPVPVITATDNCPALDPVLFINELHYDNTGGDVGEFIEIAGTAGINLANYQLAAYEGSDGMLDALLPLSGVIPNEGGGFGAVAFFLGDLNSQFFENGPREGRALIETGVGVVEFISYEGPVTAVNGPAAGMAATDIGVSEPGTTPIGESLQLTGTGCPLGSFMWTGPLAPDSPGVLNAGQVFDTVLCPSSNNVDVDFISDTIAGACPGESIINRTWTAIDACGNTTSYTQSITTVDTTVPVFCDPPADTVVDCVAPPAEDLTATDNCDFTGMNSTVWINEFHYDNAGGDVGEFIEVAGVAGTDLTGWQLVLYNGSGGAVYNTLDLAGVIDNETCNRGALFFSYLPNGIQNGSPDGIALVENGNVVEFISYEGAFIATNGPAINMMSVNIGVSETGGTPIGFSLQLTGTAGAPQGFAWTAPSPQSPGSLNAAQVMQGNLLGVLTETGTADACTGGTITRTWDVMDGCGNPASHTQMITVNPAAPPTITCPLDMTVQCEADIVVNANDVMVTTDCGLGFVTWVDQPHITGARDCDGTTYEYTYHAVDDCGNEANCIQTWTLANAAPTISVPADATIDCFDDIVVNESDATVTTSCGEDLDVTIYTPEINGEPNCPNTTYTFTYRVEDQCEREATADRVFTIADNPGPTIVAPADFTCECIAQANPGNAEVTTSCGVDYEVEVSAPMISSGLNCPGSTVTYNYTVTDACGRTAMDQQVVTISSGPPVFTNLPTTPFQLNCEDQGWELIVQAYLASVTAEAYCGGAATVTNNYNPNNQGLCINNGTTNVIFTATDDCGGQTTTTAMIILADTEPPVFVEEAQDELDICNFNTAQEFAEWVAAHGNAIAYDGCWGDDLTWSTIPNNPSINCMSQMGSTSVTVTFVVRDGCGNKASTTATFTALMESGGFIDNGEGEAEATKGSELELFQNIPNPFKDETLIGFYLPEATKAILTIYDISGRKLKQITNEYTAGYNSETIDRSHLPQAGLFYYELRTETRTITKKMVLIE